MVILARELGTLRQSGYPYCLAIKDKPQHFQVPGDSGTVYHVELWAIWDDGHGRSKNLRVLVSVCGWGMSCFSPLTRDFIIAPDGSFVGE